MLLNKPRAHEVMAEQGVAALVATSSDNVTYTSGLSVPSHATRPGPQVYALLPADESLAPCVVVSTGSLDHVADGDGWFTEAYRFGFFAIEIPAGADLSPTASRLAALMKGPDHGDAVAALVAALCDRGLDRARIAVDEIGMLPANVERLRQELPEAEIVPGFRVFRQIRTIKTAEEIERLRGSVRTAERSIQAALAIAREGVTELELLAEYQKATVAAGGVPAAVAVGSGPRSALPDAQASPRKVARGEVIRFDGGVRFKHYRSDIARIGALGEPAARVRQYYRAIRTGVEAVIAEIRPGVKTAHLFQVALDTIRREGIPHFQRNHVGHGIGINNYDAPDLTPKSPEVVEEGMVLCIETPYYELGFAGLQIENTVVVRRTSAESLMSLDNELRIV